MSERATPWQQHLLRLLRGRDAGATLTRGSLAALLVQSLSALLALGLHVLLARLLGVEHYGRYVYARTWVDLLALLCLLGLDAAAVRFVAQYTGQQQWALLRGFLRGAGLTALGSSLALAALAALLLLLPGRGLAPELRPVLLLGCLLLPPATLLGLEGAQLRGFKAVGRALYPRELVRPALCGLGAVGLWALRGPGLGASQMIGVDLAASAAALLLAWLHRRALTPPQVRQVPAQRQLGHWCRVALPMLLIAAFGIWLQRADLLLVGMMLGARQTSLYAVAGRLSLLVSFMRAAVRAIAAPLVAELYHRDERPELQRVLRLSAWAMLLFAAAVAGLLWLLGPWVLSLFGPAFPEVALVLGLLASGRALLSAAGIATTVMEMTGHQRQSALLLAAGASVHLLLLLGLVPRLGLWGAAWATVIATSAVALAATIYARLSLGLNTTVLPLGSRVGEKRRRG